MRKGWLRQHAMRLVRSFAQSLGPSSEVECHSGPEDMRKAISAQLRGKTLGEQDSAAIERQIAGAKPSDARKFKEFVQQRWRPQWDELPEFVRGDEGAAFEAWFASKSVSLVVDYFNRGASREASQDPAMSIWPLVEELLKIESVSNDQMEALRALARRSEQVDQEPFAEFIATLWQGQWATVPVFARADEDDAKRAWFTQRSAELLCTFLEQRRQSAAAGAGHERSSDRLGTVPSSQAMPAQSSNQSMKRCAVSVGEVLFASPKQRARRTSGPTTYVRKAASDVHSSEAGNAIGFTIVALVLFVRPECRMIEVENRRTKAMETVAALTLLLADGTGPVLCDLWRSTAERFLRDYRSWTTTGDAQVIIELQEFRITHLSRRNMPCFPASVRKIMGVENTTWKKLDGPLAEEALASRTGIPDAFYVADFSCLDTSSNLYVNALGVVASLGEETGSSDGTPVRQFLLHDHGGRFVAVQAFGRHAANPCLLPGNEVILCFAQARLGLASSDGNLWLYFAHRQNCSPQAYEAPTEHALTLCCAQMHAAAALTFTIMQAYIRARTLANTFATSRLWRSRLPLGGNIGRGALRIDAKFRELISTNGRHEVFDLDAKPRTPNTRGAETPPTSRY